MSHHSKSGQRRKKHLNKQRLKRRFKRVKAKLIAEGKIKKGIAPVSKQVA